MLWKSGHFSRNLIWRTQNRVPRFRNVRLISRPGLHSRIAVVRARRILRISNIASTGNVVEGMSLRWKDLSRAGFIAQSRVSDFQKRPNCCEGATQIRPMPPRDRFPVHSRCQVKTRGQTQIPTGDGLRICPTPLERPLPHRDQR